MTNDGFKGFSAEFFSFFHELRMNNNKTWFDAHRDEYDLNVIEPARKFVFELGNRLKESAPGVIADPRVNRSLFRINRDVRFSNDKRPYKTNLGLWFWEGDGARMEASGLYLNLEPGDCFLGVGMYCFPPALMTRYRTAVDDPKQGATLQRIVEALRGAQWEVGGMKYKRVPQGFDARHPRGDLLKYDGIYSSRSFDQSLALDGPALIGLSVEAFGIGRPLHDWLRRCVVEP